jgi:hypothetical protein
MSLTHRDYSLSQLGVLEAERVTVHDPGVAGNAWRAHPEPAYARNMAETARGAHVLRLIGWPESTALTPGCLGVTVAVAASSTSATSSSRPMAAGLDGRVYLTNGVSGGWVSRSRRLGTAAESDGNAFKTGFHVMAHLALPRSAGSMERLACAAAGNWLTLVS